MLLSHCAIGWLAIIFLNMNSRGQDRAKYGEKLLENLAKDLSKKLGKGFTQRILETSRQFYVGYPISQTLSAEFGLTLLLPVSVEINRFDWQDEKIFCPTLPKG